MVGLLKLRVGLKSLMNGQAAGRIIEILTVRSIPCSGKMSKSKISKSKSSSTKKKATVAPTVQKGKSTTMVRRDHVETLCGLTDPFCPAALSARYLDFGKVRSLPVPFHYRALLPTNNAGYGGALILPNYNNSPVLLSTSFGGPDDAFYPATNFTVRSKISCDSTRLCNFGVVLRSIAAPLGASGMVHIRVYSATDGFYFSSVPGSAFNCDQSYDIPLQDLKEFCVVLKRIDPTAKNWRYPDDIAADASLNSIWTSPGWQYMTILISGGPASSSPVAMEFFENWECTFQDNNTMALLAQPAIPNNPYLSEAIDYVSSETKTFFREGIASAGRYFMGSAAKALTNIVGARLGPLARAVPMIVD